MDTDHLLQKINQFIGRVNRIDAICEQGLRNTEFPDEKILSLHNHLGNAKHYISDELTAFNATEQFLSLKHAQNSLRDASDDLFTLHRGDIINQAQYDGLNDNIHELNELLSKSVDPEYT